MAVVLVDMLVERLAEKWAKVKAGWMVAQTVLTLGPL
jgi:hypothetical protein